MRLADLKLSGSDLGLIPTTTSTITYDTLVRAGISCTSAYVAADDDESSTFTNPPFAKGSRGINILPDTFFSPQEATPVRHPRRSGTFANSHSTYLFSSPRTSMISSLFQAVQKEQKPSRVAPQCNISSDVICKRESTSAWFAPVRL